MLVESLIFHFVVLHYHFYLQIQFLKMKLVFIIRKYYKHTYLLFLFPLIFAFSRIYLGLHYPGDILTGYLVGGIFGFGFYELYLILGKKYNF